MPLYEPIDEDVYISISDGLRLGLILKKAKHGQILCSPFAFRPYTELLELTFQKAIQFPGR